ncbi:hypothetical protein Gasu2_33670 [Galdieria sulphuraria]|nr:hypothetical protein Gasu2_33670 [Galdieria sulphuraria]
METASEEIRKQVEFYFSPSSLSRRGFLRDIVKTMGGVPIDKLRRFRKISEILSRYEIPEDDQENLIHEALKNSSCISFGVLAKPVNPVFRNEGVRERTYFHQYRSEKEEAFTIEQLTDIFSEYEEAIHKLCELK